MTDQGWGRDGRPQNDGWTGEQGTDPFASAQSPYGPASAPSGYSAPSPNYPQGYTGQQPAYPSQGGQQWNPASPATGPQQSGYGYPQGHGASMSSPVGPQQSPHWQSSPHPGGPHMAYQAPPPAKSGGGFWKWSGITCLGCAGIAALCVIALIVLAVLTPSSDSGSSQGRNGDPAVSDGGGDGAEDSEGGAQQSGLYVGSTGEMEGLTMTVADTERTTHLSDDLWASETGYEFFVIDLDIENTGSEPVEVSYNEFKIVDKNGTVYGPNSDVMFSLEEPLIMEDVNPGIVYTGTIVFEVPPGIEFSEIRWTDSYSDDTPKITIALK